MIDLRPATGRGVRVAVVDSGVLAHHPHVKGVADGFGVDLMDGEVRIGQDFRDTNGHGTACAGVIRWGSPGAEIVAVRALDQRLTTRTEILIAVLDRLAEKRVGVINLSLGAPREDARTALAAATERLLDRGVIIVGAVRPDGRPSWPTDVPGVLDVGADPDLPDWTFAVDEPRPARTAEQPLVTTSPYPRPIPGQPPQQNLSGTSFAAPRIAALAARALEIAPDLDRDRLVDVLRDNAPLFDSRGSRRSAASTHPDRGHREP